MSPEMVASPGAPLVSAIIPARDAELHLARAIDSALGQTGVPIEVIVVDDGSRDRTCEIAQGYGDRLRLIRLGRPMGPGGARNAGIKTARGTYLAFLDADDEWLPGKTARQVPMLESAPDMTFVFCRAAFVPAGPGSAEPVSRDWSPVGGNDAWKMLLARPFVSTPTVLARREAILRAGLFDPTLTIAEDQDLWIRLAQLGPIGYIEDVLVRVHDTPSSLMKRHASEGALATWRLIERHLEAAAADLTESDIRGILVERSARLGRNAYEAGATVLGMRLLLRSIRLGHPTMPILAYLMSASALGRKAKALLRAGSARR